MTAEEIEKANRSILAFAEMEKEIGCKEFLRLLFPDAQIVGANYGPDDKTYYYIEAWVSWERKRANIRPGTCFNSPELACIETARYWFTQDLTVMRDQLKQRLDAIEEMISKQ
jgi:hypothetical protein